MMTPAVAVAAGALLDSKHEAARRMASELYPQCRDSLAFPATRQHWAALFCLAKSLQGSYHGNLGTQPHQI